MKVFQYIPITTLLIVSSSCSTINEILGRDTHTNTTNTTQTKTTLTRKHRGKVVKDDISTASRSHSSIVSPNQSFTTTDSIALVKSLAGEWIFESVSGISITGEDNRPSITFDDSSNRFYANNSCNFFNGRYNIGGVSNMMFTDIISSVNLCTEIEWADYITALWPNVKYFTQSLKGTEQYIKLKNHNNKTIAILKRHSSQLLNGMWDVTEINGRKLKDNKPTIVIDLIERKVHGNTGCNIFNGEIYQNADIEMSIQFQGMKVSRVGCPYVETETAMLIGMELVEKALIETPDDVILTDNNNRHIIRLSRTVLQ